jgi:hypothetical protein
MDHYDVKRLALVLAVQAEIEGMKSENTLHATHATAPKYCMDDFQSKASELGGLAYAHNENLFG